MKTSPDQSKWAAYGAANELADVANWIEERAALHFTARKDEAADALRDVVDALRKRAKLRRSQVGTFAEPEDLVESGNVRALREVWDLCEDQPLSELSTLPEDITAADVAALARNKLAELACEIGKYQAQLQKVRELLTPSHLAMLDDGVPDVIVSARQLLKILDSEV